MYSNYKNKASIVVESDVLRAELLPDPGAKLVSLINKQAGYEYLVQREGEIYRDQPFGGDYIKGECSGFDDMFPTIDKCTCENEPWKGVEMVDHGEVWSLPWEFEQTKHALIFSVRGIHFPYRLTKKVFFAGPRTLRFEYTLNNTSDYDFDFLWAGHLMVNIEQGARLILPEDCREAFTVLTNGGGQFGDIRQWPSFKDKTGSECRADICRAPSAEGFEKYYFTEPLTEGWCELQYPDRLKKLRIDFSVDTVPYLGILMNENGWDNLYNIFIEPCTVCYDRPDLAKKYGQISTVKSQETYQWYLQITV